VHARACVTGGSMLRSASQLWPGARPGAPSVRGCTGSVVICPALFAYLERMRYVGVVSRHVESGRVQISARESVASHICPVAQPEEVKESAVHVQLHCVCCACMDYSPR